MSLVLEQSKESRFVLKFIEDLPADGDIVVKQPHEVHSVPFGAPMSTTDIPFQPTCILLRPA